MSEPFLDRSMIAGRYEALETLGAGGEARVVKALDHQHGRAVALKIRQVRGAQAREELLSEARLLPGLPPHPALPLVREDFFVEDEYVVAMDRVDGTDLGRILAERGTPGLAPSSVVAHLAEAAEALMFLHAQDPPIAHGDVKPANLILTRGGHVKLVDFGLSSTPLVLGRRSGTPGVLSRRAQLEPGLVDVVLGDGGVRLHVRCSPSSSSRRRRQRERSTCSGPCRSLRRSSDSRCPPPSGRPPSSALGAEADAPG